MILNNDDVNEILQLLDTGPFREFHLQTLRFKLLLRRDGDGEVGWTQSTEILDAPNLVQNKIPDISAGNAAAQPENQRTTIDQLHAVRAPLPGIFYRAPKPGAAPFVEVGSDVQKDTLVGIVETMKLMNSVYAGTAGKVVEICCKNGELVEKDAVLIYLEAESAA